jgi:hypothetical protein
LNGAQLKMPQSGSKLSFAPLGKDPESLVPVGRAGYQLANNIKRYRGPPFIKPFGDVGRSSRVFPFQQRTK